MLRGSSRLLAPSAAIAAAVALAGCTLPLIGKKKENRPAAAPQASAKASESHAAERLGFPAFATLNTTRVGGQDPTADAAGVALATFPSTTPEQRPAAISLVGSSDWAAGIAAAVLAGPPVRAPVLVGEPGSVPGATQDALNALEPKGGNLTDDAQVFRIGNVQVPAGLSTTEIPPGQPADEAAVIANLRDRLFGGPPRHVVVASSEDPAFAMPAAAWAARSGDPVLFAQRDSVPASTMAALRRYHQLPIYLLGPPTVLSSKVMKQIGTVSKAIRRVAGKTPTENAIALARYSDADFGWNLNDPGHGFVIATAARPMDAAAAAALSAAGTWGALLVSEQADGVAPALRTYLLSIKPGYKDDPTRAVYNHIWLIGDEKAISVATQAAIDQLAELAKIGSPELQALTQASAPPASKKTQATGAKTTTTGTTTTTTTGAQKPSGKSKGTGD